MQHWWDLLRGHAQLLVADLETQSADSTMEITQFAVRCARSKVAAGLSTDRTAAYVYLQELARTVQFLIGIALDTQGAQQ
ncbi:hypothetical protein GTW98_13125 [Streptomyces sp. SID8375]|nr:hypothetical protein [Streptomyces sp. SID8375]